MVQPGGEEADAEREIHAQDNERNDEHKVEETDGEVLPRDVRSSRGPRQLREVEIPMITVPLILSITPCNLDLQNNLNKI